MDCSEQCEEYAVYSRRNRSKEPFPISAKELIQYIRYRGRSKTFRKFLVKLDIHPLHGPEWLKQMKNDTSVLEEMRRLIKKWRFNLADTTSPLVGVDYNLDPSYYDATESDDEKEAAIRAKKLATGKKGKKTTTTTATMSSSSSSSSSSSKSKAPVRPVSPPRFPNVYSVSGPKTKVGFVFASKPVEEETKAIPSSKSSANLRPTAAENKKEPRVSMEAASVDINLKKEEEKKATLTEVAQVVPSTPTPTDTPITTPIITPSSSSTSQVKPIQRKIAKEKKKVSTPSPIPDIMHPIVEIHEEVIEDTKKRVRSKESKPKPAKKKKKEDEIPKKHQLRTQLPKQKEIPIVQKVQQKVQQKAAQAKQQEVQPTQQEVRSKKKAAQPKQVQQKPPPKSRAKKVKKTNMIWVDVDEPVPEDTIEEFIYDNDTEFTDELYQAYLDRLERIEKLNLERGIRVVEPELMVLSHVAIEPYTI